MPFRILILPLALFFVAADGHAESDHERDGAFGRPDPAVTPGMQRDHARDFLRPEFEHERQRDLGDDESWRRRDGLQRGMDRTPPRGDSGLERGWEGLESDRGRRDGAGSRY